MPNVAGIDVSRETHERLEAFSALLVKWNKTINLVSRSTISDVWERHIVDSVQIAGFSPENIHTWTDIGSGGGLPGVVVAALLSETQPDAVLTLIESDQRKAAFLRTAVRELALTSIVKAERSENAAPQGADVFSARAVTSISGLLEHANRHLNSDGTAILPKGRTFQDELTEARKAWNFDVVAHRSLTDNEARILEIRNIRRVDA